MAYWACDNLRGPKHPITEPSRENTGPAVPLMLRVLNTLFDQQTLLRTLSCWDSLIIPSRCEVQHHYPSLHTRGQSALHVLRLPLHNSTTGIVEILSRCCVHAFSLAKYGVDLRDVRLSSRLTAQDCPASREVTEQFVNTPFPTESMARAKLSPEKRSFKPGNSSSSASSTSPNALVLLDDPETVFDIFCAPHLPYRASYRLLRHNSFPCHGTSCRTTLLYRFRGCSGVFWCPHGEPTVAHYPKSKRPAWPMPQLWVGFSGLEREVDLTLILETLWFLAINLGTMSYVLGSETVPMVWRRRRAA